MLDVKETERSFCLHGLQGLVRKTQRTVQVSTTEPSTVKERFVVLREYMQLEDKESRSAEVTA